MAIKTEQVTAALAFFVDQMLIYGVDDDGYVIKQNTGEQMLIGDAQRPILLYKERIEDHNAFILNPFAEGTGNTPSAIWFYKGLRTALFARIYEVYRMAVTVAIEEKKSQPVDKKAKAKEVDPSTRPHPLYMALASVLVEHADEKMLEELDTIFNPKTADDFIGVVYTRDQMSSRLRCALFDDVPWLEKRTPKLRKRSIELFIAVFRKIFQLGATDGLEKFTAVAKPDTAPKLSTYLQVLFNIYRDLNPYLVELGDRHLSVDLGTMNDHLQKMSEYWNNAKHAGQLVATRPQQPTQAPGVVAVPTVAPTGVPALGSTGVPSGTSVVPGLLRPDGTSAPGTMVPNVGQPGGSFVPGVVQVPPPGYYPAPGYPQQMYYQQPTQQYYYPAPGPVVGTAGLAMQQPPMPGHYATAPGQPMYYAV